MDGTGPPGGVKQLTIDREDLDAMFAQATSEAPAECCGILAGEPGGRVTRVFPMTNTRASGEEFLMDPAEQFDVVDKIRAAGLTMLAIYHSHPATPARPSEHDIQMAFYPETAHLIVSLAGAKPEAKAFRIAEGEVTALPIVTD